MGKSPKKKSADIVTDSPGDGVTTSAPGNPCSGNIGPSIMICSGGQIHLIEPPTASSTLMFDPTANPSIYWSTIAGLVKPVEPETAPRPKGK